MVELPLQITEIINTVVEEFDLSEEHAAYFYTNAQNSVDSMFDDAVKDSFPPPPSGMSTEEVIVVIRRLQELRIALLIKLQINELTSKKD